MHHVGALILDLPNYTSHAHSHIHTSWHTHIFKNIHGHIKGQIHQELSPYTSAHFLMLLSSYFSYQAFKTVALLCRAKYIIKYSPIVFQTIVNISKLKEIGSTSQTRALLSSLLVNLPECKQKTADPVFSVFQKQKSPDVRRIHFNNSYYKLNIFLEHKIFTKHCYY